MKIYIICPVRNALPTQTAHMGHYVERLESEGHEVHFPPRDVDQDDPTGGVRICHEHRSFMAGCDEVHVFWDATSFGSHFDLGMAYAYRIPIKLVGTYKEGDDSKKGYQKVLEAWHKEWGTMKNWRS